VITLVLVPVLYAIFVLDLEIVRWHRVEPRPVPAAVAPPEPMSAAV
jgi:hypothetical protein